MPSETTETLELPAAAGGPAQRYSLGRDRCVVEVSLRLAGVRLIRARLRARDGALVLTGGDTEPGPDPHSTASIEVALDARPIRITPPIALLLRGIPRRRRLIFTAADVDIRTGAQQADLDGEVTVPGSADKPWSLPLTVRVVPSEDTSILLAASGPISPQGTVRGLLTRVRRWLWLDAAVEFAR